MKTKLWILFFSVFFVINVFSQEEALAEWMQKKSTVYTELLGNLSGTVSLNYDRIVKQYERQYVNISFGFGIGPNNSFSVPFGITYTETPGKKLQHHAELGAGLTYNSLTVDENSKSRLILTGRFGYKYQHPEGGLFLRASLTPSFVIAQTEKTGFLDNMDLVYSLLSICLGYSF